LQDDKKEFAILFQLTFLAVLTVLAMLLLLVVIISGWERWICPVLLLGVISCWLVYFLQIGNVDARIHYYFFVAIIGIFYYGSREVAITDVPIIICLIIIILSACRNLHMIHVLAAIYPILILLHIFIYRDLGGWYRPAHNLQAGFGRSLSWLCHIYFQLFLSGNG
jgi:hypothetical protein